MKKLYFERSTGEKVFINEIKTENEAHDCMIEYIHKLNPNFKIYYIRQWRAGENGEYTVFDVGSHTEFFLLYD